MLLTNRFSWFAAGALGVERQRSGLKLGSEPALERLWWKRGVRVVLCSPVRCVWWCSRAVNLPHTTFPPHPEYQLSLGWWCVWSNVRRSPGILSASLSSHGSTNRKRRNQHLLAFTVVSAAYTHFQNRTSFLFTSKLYTQIKNCTENASHLLQNDAMHLKSNTFAIILCF